MRSPLTHNSLARSRAVLTPTPTLKLDGLPADEERPLLLDQHASYSSAPLSPARPLSPHSPLEGDEHLRRRRAPTARRLRSKLLFVLIAVLLAICVWASFIDDSMGEVEAAISCAFCLGLLMPLQALAHVGDDAFVAFFVGFCTNLGIEDADVCAGAVGTQAPILAHDLRSISLASHAAKNFCSTVFGLCPLQEVIPYTVAFQPASADPNPGRISTLESQAAVQADIKRKKWVGKGRKPFQVIHLSDVHIDRKYIFGNENCDAPAPLVDSMFRAIEQFAPNRTFTIFTGDIIEAAVWAVTPPSVTRDMYEWYHEMEAPSYPSLGNHDVSPVNAFPRTTSNTLQDSQWVFDIAAEAWERWIGPEASQQAATHYGCYARVHPGTKLKIISLNTQYWYKQNFWLYDSDEPQWDPNGILSWMATELHLAEEAGQRVWIIGHMPFGKVDALRDQSNYANQIFQRYSATIAAHFYGHSHVDEFEIAYPNYHDQRAETANGIAFMSGALTPASGNPVFRVYDVDPDTYEIMDFTPFYTNRSEPAFDIEPVWQPYYSARESYGALIPTPLAPEESLDGPFWHRVTEAMQRDESVFQLYNTRLSRGGKVSDCATYACKNRTICMLRSMRAENNCITIKPGLSFKDKKRDPDDEEENDDPDGAFGPLSYDTQCEGPGLGSMLRKLADSKSAETLVALHTHAIDALRSHGHDFAGSSDPRTPRRRTLFFF
ncbi:hypothetical protein RQP46_011345 [Phenoliferia psychrophenolica]